MVPKVAVDVDDEETCDVVIVDADEDDCDKDNGDEDNGDEDNGDEDECNEDDCEEDECDEVNLYVDVVDGEVRVELELIGGTAPSKNCQCFDPHFYVNIERRNRGR